MTPQLQQAIKLLQLSSLDLQREIQEALDSNLMLELSEDEGSEAASDNQALTSGRELERGIAGDSRDADAEASSLDIAANGDAELNPETVTMPDDLATDSDWSDTFEGYVPNGGGGPASDFDPLAQQSRPQTLHDHLEWQLNLSHLSERDQAIAEALIDAIDADGYLRLDLDDLVGAFADDELELDEVEAVLHRIQSLDPVGVGARDTQECLLLQLRQLPPEQSARNAAIAICEQGFAALTRNDMDALRKATGLDLNQLAEALLLVRSMNPRPGGVVGGQEAEYVVPEVVVSRQRGRWLVDLNPEIVPRLRVNADYAQLIRRGDDAPDNLCLKTHLQEARWFIKSLASRNDTILRVARKIVELQQEFFEFGEERMRPLVLRDVADSLELHESTISRVTTQKYMQTPRGTFEFKYFFSSHVNTASGGEASSTAIRAVIRKLIAAESPGKPLSDSKIAGILTDKGINVARRTVAKYREAMGIPASNERKRLV